MRRLVFIVGAGASKSFGDSMPVGAELASRIKGELDKSFSGHFGNSDGPIAKALKYSSTGLTQELFQAGKAIRRGLIHQASIDDLLREWAEDHPEMVRVGKTAIAHFILEAEGASTLGPTISNDEDIGTRVIDKLGNSWLAYLMRHLRRDSAFRRDPSSAFSNVAFIVFNYDRCVEQYLFWAFQTAGLNAQSAAAELRKIPIVHVYGSLGPLPFESPRDDVVPFGLATSNLERMADRIRTYTEEVSDHERLQLIHTLLEEAKRVVFLGFGYHRANMDLLFPNGPPAGGEFWGASERTSPAALKEASSRVYGARSVSGRFINEPCEWFLKRHHDFLE